MTLQQHFTQILKAYCPDAVAIQTVWENINLAYSAPERHYHTMAHLDNMLHQLLAVQQEIKDWDSTLMALVFHDLVYDALNPRNEEDSAEQASQILAKLGFPTERIERCITMILATKGHSDTTDTDTQYLLDADLCVLGAAWPDYQLYAAQIRQEYAIFPDELYLPGRAKVLQHFINMPFIYKTARFRASLEQQAKQNLAAELQGFS